MSAELLSRVRRAVQRDRLLDTAIRLVELPSPTGQAGAVSDRLAEILSSDGFAVDRVAAGHLDAPAVVVRFDSGRPGYVLQFDGHLDTVHLPFVAPKVVGTRLTGSGASDMKGGIAAMTEALRAIRDTGALAGGSILLTAHDLHEAPWGFGQQLDQMIRDGLHGDAVLIPEPLTDHLPIVGRGNATWKVRIRRPGPPIHEVMRPTHEPNVIAAGADLVRRMMLLNEQVEKNCDPAAGRESLFVGQVHAGEIYNQYPQECWLEGTRRWLPGMDARAVETEFRGLLELFAKDWRVIVEVDYRLIRDAFRLNLKHAVIGAFRTSHDAVRGRSIEFGPKTFVDDGNSFWRLADVPAITHGPVAGGQHTINEWVEIDEMVRVAEVYALTALSYCPGEKV